MREQYVCQGRTEDEQMNIEELKEKMKAADALVLCKSELFLQRIGGDTIDTIYPCAKVLALLLGDLFGKEVSFE